MKKATFDANNQTYVGFVILENLDDLKEIRKKAIDLPLGFMYDNKRHSDNLKKLLSEGYKIAINPSNLVSYFPIRKDINIVTF